MARTAWVWTDNVLSETLEMEINPNAFDAPSRKANILQESTTAPNGQLVIFQGRDQAKTAKLSGAINSESFYNDMLAWTEKWYPLVLADDLGQSWNILVTASTFNRLRRSIHPWRFDYTIDVLVF